MFLKAKVKSVSDALDRLRTVWDSPQGGTFMTSSKPGKN